MSREIYERTITFGELHHYMMLDPFYGLTSTATDSIINAIYRESAGNALYRHFRERFSSLPSKGETGPQRHLIYIWCGLMGLPTYRDGSPLGWQREDFLDNWTQENFDFRLGELKIFLRHHSWPLPATFFPDEPDNAQRKVALDEAEYARAFSDFAVALPQLEKELEELQNIQPESMEAHLQRKTEIDIIKRKIAAIRNGNNKSGQETPDERKQRLQGWFQEERLLRGERGAQTRTAEREGITRQTLSQILKRIG